MGRLGVTHTEEGQWLVSQEGQAMALCPSEEKALLVTFALAAKHRQVGARAVIIDSYARDGRNGGIAQPLSRPSRT